MKLKNILFYAGAGLLIGGLAACKKKLELYPFGSIELSQSFKVVGDAKAWNNGMYSQLRPRVSGLYTYSTDIQADQLNAIIDFGNRNGSPHRWDDTFNSDDYTIRDIWAGYYGAITNLNIAINGFPNITTTAAWQVDTLKKYTGDMHLARAYYYFQLASLWSKSYDPATASTELSVPLVLTYDVNAKPTRATVAQVYDNILGDINIAKTNLAIVNGSQGATRFTKDAVSALEARVKLNMKDWLGAKAAADAVISSGRYPLYNTQDNIKNMWARDLAQEDIFRPAMAQPNELAGTSGFYLGYNGSTNRYTPDFIPSQWVVDMYAETDYRKKAYFDSTFTVALSVGNFRNIYLVNKYPGNPIYFTGANTNYQHAPKVFRVAELYLISAEAGAMSSDPAAQADALVKLNALRVARGLTSINVSGTALLDEIKNERFRELAFEGFRLNDLKRWNMGFTRRQSQNPTLLMNGSTYNTLTIAAGNNKFVWGLPANDYTINTNLRPQNPGW